MAKYACPSCSRFAHTSGGIPNQNEWLFISAVDWDAMPEKIDSSNLYIQANKFYKCVSCDALAIFWENKVEPIWYSPVQGVNQEEILK